MNTKVYLNKITKNGDSLRLGIPKQIVKKLNLGVDDLIRIVANPDGFSVNVVKVDGVKL